LEQDLSPRLRLRSRFPTHSLRLFFILSLVISLTPNLIWFLQSGVFSMVRTADFFWLCLIVYAVEIRGVLRTPQVKSSWDQTFGRLFGMFFWTQLSPDLLIRMLLVPYIIFLFPAATLGSMPYSAPLRIYTRLIIGLGVYIGFSSGITYFLGWNAPVKLKREDTTVSVLSNSFSILSMLSLVFVVVLFSLSPSVIWKYYAPTQFSSEDISNIFGTFTRHFLNLSAVSLGLGFFAMGRLFDLISDSENRLELFVMGLVFSVLVGSILGYMIGPALYFVVTEIPFIVGSMIGVSLLVHLISQARQ